MIFRATGGRNLDQVSVLGIKDSKIRMSNLLQLLTISKLPNCIICPLSKIRKKYVFWNAHHLQEWCK